MRNPEFKRESIAVKIYSKTDQEKEDVGRVLKERFERQEPEAAERSKTEEEVELIKDVNLKLKEFVEGFGGQWLDIKPQNVHLIEVDKLSEITRKEFEESGWSAYTEPLTGRMLLFLETPSKLKLAQNLVHEMLRLNSFASVKIIQKKNKKFVDYGRAGLEFFIKDGERLFNELNEAVNTELQLKFEEKFFDGLNYTKDEWVKIKRFKEFLRSRGENDLADNLAAMDEKSKPLFYGYSDLREVLKTFIGEIYEKNKDRFNSKDDIFKLFAQAAIGGQILLLARVWEKTYGKGSFRDLGQLTKYQGPPKTNL